MAEKIRVFKTAIQDIIETQDDAAAVINSGLPPEAFERHETLRESQITAFCTGCDQFAGEGIPCKLVKADDQARYALRKWCGWASVNGKRVINEGRGLKG